MASIAFRKIHGKGELMPTLRHSDTQERLRHKHSNVDIDTALTPNNTQLKQLNYKDTLQYYDDYIKRLDHRNKNKRKDRVTAFELVFSFPDAPAEQWQAVARVIYDFIRDQFAEKNIINAYLHQDEIHQYYDHGKIKTSRPHIHAFIVPEFDGQLNGKLFSSRSNMQALNRALDAYMMQKLGVHYLTHAEPRRKTVERLKLDSYKALGQTIQVKKAELEKLEKELAKRADLAEIADIYDEMLIEEREREKSRGIIR